MDRSGKSMTQGAMTWVAVQEALSSQPVTPDEARDAARRILEQGDFAPKGPSNRSRPLQQPLTWIGDQIQRLFEPIGRFLSNTVGRGGPLGWLLFAVCLIGAVSVLVRSWSKRVRTKKHDDGDEQQISERISELEALAAAAVAARRWSEAARLRFQIGLLNFELDGHIAKVERKPNREVTDLLQAPTLEKVAGLHDELAYGLASGDEATHSVIVSGLSQATQEVKAGVLAASGNDQ
jgi:hypothetical protein